MKCSVYIATSTDGFIARPDGDIGWLLRPEYEEASQLGLTYPEFISGVDAIVMGRHTYEKVLTFEEWGYEGIEAIVLTTREPEVPEKLAGKVRFLSGTPDELVTTLEREGKRHLYIDGGVTIQRFLKAGLIDELTVTQLPILLGRGLPLFGGEGREQRLELIDLFHTGSGILQKRYRVVRD
ncbi:MAG TPA: dihydrofolate reductase family protein [Balneolaceae bacterium]|nr:dihydrofolate reductase family protein [Balneolaceae bacterium]